MIGTIFVASCLLLIHSAADEPTNATSVPDNPFDWNNSFATSNITQVDIEDQHFTGPMFAEKLPRGLTSLWARSNSFTGSVVWEQLPRALLELDLHGSKLTGTIQCIDLPRGLLHLVLGGNSFSGTVSWKDLPRTLIRFDVEDTQKLFGEVSWSDLPPNMEDLILKVNQFHGTVDWATRLPSNTINIASNFFSGTVTWENLPTSLMIFDIGINEFYGSINWDVLPVNLAGFSVFGCLFIGEVPWPRLPRNLEWFDLGEGGFRGNLSLSDVPRTVNVLRLNQNDFSGSIDWHEMPPNMSNFAISTNSFHSTILPKSLSLFEVNDNLFSGLLQVWLMPSNATVARVSVGENQFSGDESGWFDWKQMNPTLNLQILLPCGTLPCTLKKRTLRVEHFKGWTAFSPGVVVPIRVRPNTEPIGSDEFVNDAPTNQNVVLTYAVSFAYCEVSIGDKLLVSQQHLLYWSRANLSSYVHLNLTTSTITSTGAVVEFLLNWTAVDMTMFTSTRKFAMVIDNAQITRTALCKYNFWKMKNSTAVVRNASTGKYNQSAIVYIPVSSKSLVEVQIWIECDLVGIDYYSPTQSVVDLPVMRAYKQRPQATLGIQSWNPKNESMSGFQWNPCSSGGWEMMWSTSKNKSREFCFKALLDTYELLRTDGLVTSRAVFESWRYLGVAPRFINPNVTIAVTCDYSNFSWENSS
eukprot:PhF_6_TR20458/c2_g1_i1/m.29408